MAGLHLPDEVAQMSGRPMKQHSDTHKRQTRRSILDAFGRLVRRRQPRRIRVSDVIAEAQVGRSTFYDHFSGAEQVHLAALREPFAVLADAAAGRGDEAATTHMLEHFWEHRARARATLEMRTGEGAVRMLAELIEQRLEGPMVLPAALVARQLAAASLGAISPWLLGEVSAKADALASALCRGGAAQVASLKAPLPEQS